ncbi:lipocalin family protein [Phaeovibrio sulfidiphilus]|uniref:Lipocalin family protein n=1 Tax=Phaeovibrio sulfidiphilus TaxID=1220600 RepID=A0A8J6YUV6_9PROT|nr:lipocalin family protein [Phaeovibrio sulfidiphilus]MBE1236177.1 lipocalin family protein [Phaeovibrio sulfidiphilus]
MGDFHPPVPHFAPRPRRGILGRIGASAAEHVLGATRPPAGVRPVHGFDATCFLGRWYEIFRLDDGFETHLSNVSMEFLLLDGGRFRVVNRGFDRESLRWRKIEGVAVFAREPWIGSFSLSFFWPWRRGFHVMDVDPSYRRALACGPDRDHLWLLAREPYVHEADISALMEVALDNGFEADDLIRVVHDRDPPCDGFFGD